MVVGAAILVLAFMVGALSVYAAPVQVRP